MIIHADKLQPFLRPGSYKGYTGYITSVDARHLGASLSEQQTADLLLYTENFCHLWVPFMHGPLPEATQSTTVPIKFVPPVSDLPSSVEAQNSSTRASTSVVFAPGPLRCTLTVALHGPSHQHDFDIREIFECAQFKFTVSGWSIAR